MEKGLGFIQVHVCTLNECSVSDTCIYMLERHATECKFQRGQMKLCSNLFPVAIWPCSHLVPCVA